MGSLVYNLEQYNPNKRYSEEVQQKVNKKLASGKAVWDDITEAGYQKIKSAYGLWITAPSIPFTQCTKVGQAVEELQSICKNEPFPVKVLVGFELYLLLMYPKDYFKLLNMEDHMDVVDYITADNDLLLQIGNTPYFEFVPKGDIDELYPIAEFLRNTYYQPNVNAYRSNKRGADDDDEDEGRNRRRRF